MHTTSSGSSPHFSATQADEQAWALMRYIARVGSELRRHTELDTLLKHLATTIHQLPGFTRSTLYLSDAEHFARLALPSTLPENSQEPDQFISLENVRQLTDEQYCVDEAFAAYLLPLRETIFQHTSTEIIPSQDPTEEISSTSVEQEKALVVIPLQGQGSLLGLLIGEGVQINLTMALPHLALFSDEVAILLERAHLHEEIHQVNDERLALIEVGRSLAAPEALQNVQTVYQVIYEQVQRLMPIDVFFINRYDQEKDKLVRDFQVVNGRIQWFPSQIVISDELKCFFSYEQKYIIYNTNEEFTDYLRLEMPEVYKTNEFQLDERMPQSVMFTMIAHGEEPVGQLGVQSFKPHSYLQKHLQMLREISVLAAEAIKSARMYEELRAALVQAQESERLKNRFLTTASHELRTPLTSVHGYLEMLDEMKGMLEEEMRERFINNARRASEELVLIVSTIMDASRLDQDKVELKPETIKLADTVHTIVEILQSHINKEARIVERDIAETIAVRADDLRLRQIILNLLTNALKYTPAQTPIKVSAESLDYVRLRRRFPALGEAHALVEGKRYAVISVRDQGPGIALEEQGHLFNKFTRLNGAINSQQRGAGLGLYLCRQLAEAMEGAIWLESSGKEGDGCIFRVALPIAEAEGHGGRMHQ